MELARIELAPNGSLLTYITSADALVNDFIIGGFIEARPFIGFRIRGRCTVLPAKSDSDVMFCLQLLSKTLTDTHHLS